MLMFNVILSYYVNGAYPNTDVMHDGRTLTVSPGTYDCSTNSDCATGNWMTYIQYLRGAVINCDAAFSQHLCVLDGTDTKNQFMVNEAIISVSGFKFTRE